MSKSLSKDEIALNAHVDELRQRMAMLKSDRDANVDVLEANKAANKEEIKKLRKDNKDYRQKLANLQRVSKHNAVMYYELFVQTRQGATRDKRRPLSA